MNNNITSDKEDNRSPIPTLGLEDLAYYADKAAYANLFRDFFIRVASNTRRSYEQAANLFAVFLEENGHNSGDLMFDAQAWRGLSFGIVHSFQYWMLNQGYAIGTINNYISHIRIFANLAMKVGVITPDEYQRISGVQNINPNVASRVDDQRAANRVGGKKKHPVLITQSDARKLKKQPDTPQGCRDALIICLLLDHGLRVSEIAGLTVDGVNLEASTLSFFRPKVHKFQTHALSKDTRKALLAWFNEGYAPPAGPLLCSTLKDGNLSKPGITSRSIFDAVRKMGERVGVAGLSPHDCRHYWATQWARQDGINPFALQQAGGWKSVSAVQKYIRDLSVSNQDLINLPTPDSDDLPE